MGIEIANAKGESPDAASESWSKLAETKILSTLDGHEQPVLYLAPNSTKGGPTPLLVYLHSWSTDYHQRNTPWLDEAIARGWLFLHPNFRGRNDHPEACGSRLARQDILDAIDWMASQYSIDTHRIYLAGTSGGGHMTMLMVGHHPDRFSAASSWVGISDLAEWYHFHSKLEREGSHYDRDMLQALGGAPGASPQIDLDYADRSPCFHVGRAVGVPLDIAAGVDDGHTGSVSVHHAFWAFNPYAAAHGANLVSAREIEELWADRKLSQPTKEDQQTDPVLQRAIRLRRTAGPGRVTIFDGGHEGLAHAACAWLAEQNRATTTKTP